MMLSFQIGNPTQQQDRPQGSKEPKAKRAKISVACNSCKSRKTKCDGLRPACNACLKRKQSCIYREVDEVSHLDVEASPKDLTEEASSDQDVVPTGSLFGASSGAHIIPSAAKATYQRSAFGDGTDNGARAGPKPLKELPKLRKRQLTTESDSQFAIPPRKVADDMLASYWDYVDTTYPWLDRPSIERAYLTLWTQDGEVPMNERALHCILNLMFAASCVASQGQSLLSRYESSGVFFDRAQQLMSCELTSIYNFEIIQILLLTAVYLQHERVPQKCFRNIGMAIHIAQELGLHLPETTEAISNPHERDLARQVWNGCIIMDRIASMTFGCVLKISQDVAKQGLDSLVLNPPELVSDSKTSTLPCKIDFYISFCRLHYIIGEVLETFYISTSARNGSFSNKTLTGFGLASSLSLDKFATLFRLELDLNNWAGSLHPFFQLPSDTADLTPTKHFTRQANVLRARYLCVRLLLFRPFLLQIQQHDPDASPQTSLYRDEQLLPHVVSQCQIHCFKAASDIIEFIVRNLPERTHAYILPSNWYTVSYVYMAVTVLLAAKMSPRIIEYFSRARLDGLLRQARDILKSYEQHTTLASRCTSVLGLIERNIDRRGSGDNGNAEIWQTTGDNDYTATQDRASAQQEPQPAPGNLSWVENYTFDWNEWPTFFAQLDDTVSLVDSWELSM
ncbi:uncharacterized protein N7511_008634 [Penicillium nucicola]|uniref:uncharacterized protein n=1 Tax=Penicillium nucicola TaxID=1850975 RepID=UPI002545921F|nr:uncharacterized protein N7511_008634 [Penicillium nucicola]KAJ5746938.1 hypothetical protein N7511_008634 [Penicillium nucicola]